MSEIYKLEYKRHVLRGVSGLMSVTAMKAMTMTAYQRMASSSWLAVDEQTSDLPPHKYDQTGHLDTYDAAKYCGDYANGKQKAYACAACYSIRLPEDARGASPAKVEAIIASVYGDRWLAEGAVVSAFLSANESPPDWATIIDNTSSLASTPDPAPAIDEVTVPDWQSPLRASVRSNAGPDHRYDAVITANVPSNATAYLHIVIRLSDYISVPKITLPDGTQKDSSWIEGGAAIDGATLQVQFDRSVLDDAPETIELTPKRFASTEIRRYIEYDIADMCFFRYKRATFSNLSSDEAFWDWSFRERICHYPDSLLLHMRLGTSLEIGSEYAPTGFRYAGIHTAVISTDAYVDFSSLVYGRTGVSRGGMLTGIKMDNSVPSITNGIPDGQTFRLSFYLATANYSVSSGASIPNQVHEETYVSRAFWDGSASSIKLSGYNDDYSEMVQVEVPVTPVTHIDLDESLAAETVIPLPEPIPLPSGLVILIACLSLHSLAAGYDKPTDVDTSVTWNPEGSFYLMTEQ